MQVGMHPPGRPAAGDRAPDEALHALQAHTYPKCFDSFKVARFVQQRSFHRDPWNKIPKNHRTRIDGLPARVPLRAPLSVTPKASKSSARARVSPLGRQDRHLSSLQGVQNRGVPRMLGNLGLSVCRRTHSFALSLDFSDGEGTVACEGQSPRPSCSEAWTPSSRKQKNSILRALAPIVCQIVRFGKLWRTCRIRRHKAQQD